MKTQDTRGLFYNQKLIKVCSQILCLINQSELAFYFRCATINILCYIGK